MANVLINEDTMTDIADAIRSKKGVSTTYKPSDMPSAIESISGGGVTPTGTINITTNGTHDVTNYASANVAVPQGTTPTGTKQISITQNGTTTEDVTNYASAQITVNVPTGGGGATLINEVAISASHDVQINIDSTWFNDYDIVYIEITGTASSADWIYYGFDTTSPQAYSNKSATVNVKFIAYAFGNTFAATVSSDRQSATKNNPEYLYAKLYSSSNTMTGSYKVYGITI